jgi:hypothetical protein
MKGNGDPAGFRERGDRDLVIIEFPAWEADLASLVDVT